MLRNVLYNTASHHPNVDVGVVIRNRYIEVEGAHFDPCQGVIVLELDEEALHKALNAERPGQSPANGDQPGHLGGSGDGA
jgi:hypothetical protein